MPTLTIPPVFVLSTGRCGSTMVSDILNRHPDVLSISVNGALISGVDAAEAAGFLSRK